jgi:hypothetical protein
LWLVETYVFQLPQLHKHLNVGCNVKAEVSTMTRDKLKTLLDFLPLFILTAYAAILLWTVETTNIAFSYEHYIGFALLMVTIVLFLWRHKLGVLFLGFTLILGLFKVLSYSGIIDYHRIGGSINETSSGDIKIQGIFILWLILHFILSGRHYVGILTKKYWQDLFEKAKTQPA